MKKLYEKSELTFAIVCIAVYCVLQSLANPLNKMIGIAYSASADRAFAQTCERPYRAVAALPCGIHRAGAENSRFDGYETICCAWRGLRHLCVSGEGIFVKAQGIRGRSSTDAGGQKGTNCPRRLDGARKSHLCSRESYKGQLVTVSDQGRL